ncbi:MAG TPA: DEAD/DEAH box helicase, partial [Cytophagaceae bacterium]|nr:DEAD/DEAH box helicase [Cytophagaceae bacterium]
MNFEELNLHPDLLAGLSAMAFNKPTPIQEQAIPVILSGRDLIACAQTGTGKTGAYILPVLHKIVCQEKRHLNTIIIAPTRELALQIDQQVEGFSYFLGISSLSIYGGGDGKAWDQQKKALKEGTDLIIATPGRFIALLTAGDINFEHVEHLILDEADRMLDMGFNEDIERIISYLPVKRQTLLFSATMPPKIRQLANKILKNPAEINIAISKPAEGILQQAYVVYDGQKIGILKNILKEESFTSILIFASTKENVKALNKELNRNGFPTKAFHSDLEQEEREDVMREFKSKQLRIIVGTDILSRGIDVEGISLVVNYDAPPDPEDYIHRIGRTARAETTGVAITFINQKDQKKFFRIESLIGKEIEKIKIPQEFGEGPVYDPNAKAPG